jgi:glyoxylase-like metal-dependent hydrolase (beta-lactamase superfamily II)/rhodanese-related sulfurtransferase
MATITPETLSARLEQGDSDLLLLDIRHTDVFEEWHIPGSTNIDVYDALTSDPETTPEAFDHLPQNKEIVTVCGVGEVSDIATDVLQDMGYEAKTLIDGMSGWSRVHLVAPVSIGTGQLFQVARPGTGCLSYVLISDDEAAVIDPSQYTENYEHLIDAHDATLTAVIETHAHADHISGARALAVAHDAPYYLHPADAGDLPDLTALEDGQTLTIGAVTIDILHTPGHTAGSVTFDVGGEGLLTGDTLFLDSVGRPDLEGGDETAIRGRAKTLYESLQRVLDRPDDALVLPAHDPGSPDPPTTAPLTDVRGRNDPLATTQAAFIETITANIPETPPNHEQIKRGNVGTETVDTEKAQELELGPNQCAANES